MNEDPYEKLHRLAEEFHRYVSGENSDSENKENILKNLTSKFGLSKSQAKAWLKKEPNFTTDEFLHEPRNRRRVDRTIVSKIYITATHFCN